MQAQYLIVATIALFVGMTQLGEKARGADRERDDPVEAAPVSKYLESGREAVDRKDFQAALQYLTKAASETPNSADVHNLLGYSYRKLGKVEKAFEHYRTALKIDPMHRGANEYIGELYLETGEPTNAQKHLEVLSKACFWGCEEYDDLKKAIENYKARSSSAQ